MAAAPLTWVTDPPPVPGWYWWRLAPEHPPQVLHLYRVCSWLQVDGDRYGPRTADSLGGLWAGPLAPPD